MMFFKAHYNRLESIENDNKLLISTASALESSFACASKIFPLTEFSLMEITDAIAFPPTTEYIPAPALMKSLVEVALLMHK